MARFGNVCQKSTLAVGSTVTYSFNNDLLIHLENTFMAVTSSNTGSELNIKITGKFDFSCHQDFRATYEDLTDKPQRFVIDLSETTYLDSSALGMLLLLRDYAGGDSAKVVIENCNPEIKKILSISNFEQLFSIS